MARVERKQRTPLGTRNVLGVKGKEPGFQYRIVNDTGDRIAEFQERGYEIVTDTNVKVGDRRVANPTKEGSPVQVSVGDGQKAYVMRIQEDWYKEDQTAKAQQINELESSMKQEAQSGMYGNIKIS